MVAPGIGYEIKKWDRKGLESNRQTWVSMEPSFALNYRTGSGSELADWVESAKG
jgi:hypothetical protein